MKEGLDIHGYSKRLDFAIRHLQKTGISQRNCDLILQFRDHCSLNNLSKARMARYLGVLPDWAKYFKKDFDQITKEDIASGVRILQENPRFTPWTKATYKVMFKCFYKWLKNTTVAPPEIAWISTTIKRTDKKLPGEGEILTEEDIQQLISVANHPRDKALVSLLYESGARISELATMQLRDIRFDKYGALLNVTGKTGPRTIRILSSTAYLMQWLDNHPSKNYPLAPLWINIGNRRHHQLIDYQSIRFLLGALFKRAGIKKRCNPHLFRHSRATYLANHLTEFQMNQYFGWIQGSGMPATYVHMSGASIDASILGLNGITLEKKEPESLLKPRICLKCDTLNSSHAKFCLKCAGILDQKTALELEQQTQEEKQKITETHDFLNLLLKDPELLKLITQRMNQKSTETV